MDYVWLLVYFVILYLFYAAFWYISWLIYLQVTSATTKPKRQVMRQMMYEMQDDRPVAYGGFAPMPCVQNGNISTNSQSIGGNLSSNLTTPETNR